MLNLRLIARAFGTPLMLESAAGEALRQVATACAGDFDPSHVKRRAWLSAARHAIPLCETAASEIRSQRSEWDGFVSDAKGSGGLYVMGGTNQDIALVDISGVLDQSQADVQDSSGNQFGTAYDTLDATMAMLETDRAVKAVMLVINSPGGLALPCAGTYAAIARLSGLKPVWSYGLGMVCSAALYLACGTSKGAWGGGMLVGHSTYIGSIGTTIYHVDESASLAKQGLKIEQISSAVGKTLGASHRPLGDEDKAALQAEVDLLGAQFASVVAARRGVSEQAVKAWGARRPLVGAEAVAAGGAGLADGVAATLRDAVAMMETTLGLGGDQYGPNKIKSGTHGAAARSVPASNSHAASGVKPGKGSVRMRIEDLMAMEGGPALAEALRAEGKPAAAKAASVSELRAEFAAAGSDFILGCLEKSVSMEQAHVAHAGLVSVKLESMTKALAEATDKLARYDAKLASLAGAGVRPGVEPVEHKEGGPAAGTFMDKVAEIKAQRKCGQGEATLLASKMYPELHKQYAGR